MIDYDELNFELRSVQSGIGASECHGFLAGYFCCQNLMAAGSWQDLLLAEIEPEQDPKDCLAMLSELAGQVAGQMVDDEEISFTLLLPDDETKIAARSAAVATWCAGFISGVGVSGMDRNAQFKPECDEFIKDLISISRMKTELEDSEAAENDLVEIIEYVRVGVMMLRQEWRWKNDYGSQSRVLN